MREVVLCLESEEPSSFLNSDWVETEGEGGITFTFKLEPPSDGTSSGCAASGVGVRSRAGVIRIDAGTVFSLWMDELLE